MWRYVVRCPKYLECSHCCLPHSLAKWYCWLHEARYILVLWPVTMCRLLVVYRSFWGTYYFPLLPWWWRQQDFQKMSGHSYDHILSQLAHRWRRGCQPYVLADHSLPPERFLAIISVRGWVDPRTTVQLEGLGQLRNPTNLSGIEPMTFQLTT
jgi:hypothetical protein